MCISTLSDCHHYSKARAATLQARGFFHCLLWTLSTIATQLLEHCWQLWAWLWCKHNTRSLTWAAWWGLLSFSGVAEDSVKGVHGKKAFEALLEGYYYNALHWNSKDVLITRGCLRHWLLACKVVLRTVSVSLGWFMKRLFFKGLFATIFLTICTASLGHGAQMLKSFCLLILQPKDLFTFSCRCFPLQCLSSRGKGWRRDGSSQGFCWASHSCSHSLVKAQAQILTVYVLMCQN